MPPRHSPEKENEDSRTKLQGHFGNTIECACGGTGKNGKNNRCPQCRGLGKVPVIQDTRIPFFNPRRLENEIRSI